MTDTTTDYQPLNKAILSIKRDVGAMQRDTPIENSSGRSYSVVGYEQIIAKLQPLFIKYGINVYPYVVEATSWDTYRERQDDGILIHTRESHFAKVIVDYVITDTTGQTQTVRMVGESENDNDKSMSAALSFAWKYFAKQVFDLYTGDPDPDTMGTSTNGYVGRDVIATPSAELAESNTETSRPVTSANATEDLMARELGATVVSPETTQQVQTQQSQPVLESSVKSNQNQSNAELASESQVRLISVILTGKKNDQYPNNQGMTNGQAYDFIEGIVGRALNREVHYTKKFQDLTKDEARRVMDAIKKIPGVNLPDRPRN